LFFRTALLLLLKWLFYCIKLRIKTSEKNLKFRPIEKAQAGAFVVRFRLGRAYPE
jgi:hypothetical protein